MNKADRKQADGALALLHTDPSYAARTLATIQRAGNAKTSREIAELIEAHPPIKQHLQIVNGCYIPKVCA